MKNINTLITLSIVAAFAGIYWWSSQNSTTVSSGNTSTQTPSAAPQTFSVVPVDQKLLIKPHSPRKGPENAKVTIVEFLDPECEACAGTYPLVKKLMAEYEKDVQIVVRYMTYHQNSKLVANILESYRAHNKYWEALELVFESQPYWANHQKPQPELLPEILKDLKINSTNLFKEAQLGKYNVQIEQDMQDGKQAGVQGTPTFFVNGTKVEELSYSALKEAIEMALKK